MSDTKTDFKRNDLVECVDASYCSRLTVGAHYVIDAIYDRWHGEQHVWLSGMSDPSPFRGSRFALAKAASIAELGAPAVPKTGPDKLLGTLTENILEAAVAQAEGVKKDNVVLPSHYARFKIEPIRFCIENNLNGFQFNIVKYTLRYDDKNGLEDLRKAQRYLTMFIKFVEGNEDWWRAE